MIQMNHLIFLPPALNAVVQHHRPYQTPPPPRTSFASWLLMNLLLLTVPRYGAYLMVVTGALMCLACALYSTLKPSHLMAIRLEDAVLRIGLGWQFYLVLLAGKPGTSHLLLPPAGNL